MPIKRQILNNAQHPLCVFFLVLSLIHVTELHRDSSESISWGTKWSNCLYLNIHLKSQNFSLGENDNGNKNSYLKWQLVLWKGNKCDQEEKHLSSIKRVSFYIILICMLSCIKISLKMSTSDFWTKFPLWLSY